MVFTSFSKSDKILSDSKYETRLPPENIFFISFNFSKIRFLEDLSINFVPHLIPVTRGMLVSVYATLKEEINSQEILKESYKDSEFVRVYDKPVNIKSTAGTNFCDLFSLTNGKALFVNSSIDNLLRGASTQAVVNANLMMGYDENTAIPKIAYIP